MIEKRIEWIDHVRAIAMISIVLGHAIGQFSGAREVYSWLYLFHVPLCVVISGYLFKEKDSFKQSLSYVKKILLREYVPYLFWGLISIILYLIVVDHSNLMTNALNFIKGLFFGNGSFGRVGEEKGYMVWNTPLWYLTCILSIEFVSAFLSLIKFKYSQFVFFVLSVVIGFSCYQFLHLHTWFMEFETAIYLLPFFYLGIMLRKGKAFLDTLYCKKLAAVALSVVLIAAGSVIGLLNGSPTYLSDVYGHNYIIFLVSAAMMCVGIMGVERALLYNSRALSYKKKTPCPYLCFTSLQ